MTSARWGAWFVPGRIEVLGKHTDYGGGRSLICAAERGFHVVSRRARGRRLSLTDIGRGTSLVLDADGPPPDVSWATYPLTVLRRLSRNFPELSRGVDLVFESDLPSAAGMSSSSALMVAVLLALARANRLDETARWTGNLRNGAEDLAAYAATIENGQTFRGLVGESGVGTEGGSEDHTAILCSRAGAGAVLVLPHAPRTIVALSGGAGLCHRRQRRRRAQDRPGARRLQSRVAARGAGPRTLAEDSRPRGSLAAALSSSERRTRASARPPWITTSSSSTASNSSSRRARGSCQPPPTNWSAATWRLLAARSSARSNSRKTAGQPGGRTVARRVAREHGAWAASAFGAGFGGSVWALVDQSPEAPVPRSMAECLRGRVPAAPPRARFFLTMPGPGVVELSEDSN